MLNQALPLYVIRDITDTMPFPSITRGLVFSVDCIDLAIIYYYIFFKKKKKVKRHPIMELGVFLKQSGLLLEASPDTTKIITKYRLRNSHGEILVKTYDPVTGCCFKYRSSVASDIGRINAGLAKLAFPSSAYEMLKDASGKSKASEETKLANQLKKNVQISTDSATKRDDGIVKKSDKRRRKR